MVMNIIIVPDSGHVSVLGNTNLQTANNSIGYMPEKQGFHRTFHHVHRGEKSREDQSLLDLLDSFFHSQCDVCPYCCQRSPASFGSDSIHIHDGGIDDAVDNAYGKGLSRGYSDVREKAFPQRNHQVDSL